MKILFLDFDGVVSTFEKGWRLDEEKLLLLKLLFHPLGRLAMMMLTNLSRHLAAEENPKQ